MQRVVQEIRRAIGETELDLRGLTVLTEAATGPFAVTAAIAAAGGAKRVLGVGRSTRYGTAQQAFAEVRALADALGVEEGRIEFAEGRPLEWFEAADVVTNSGHVRPLDAEVVARMKPTAVISLMYEGWEWRPEDVDLDACRQRGVAVAGVSERHPAVDVFSYLGPAAVALAEQGGVKLNTRRVLLVCDNPFLAYLEATLVSLDAEVAVVPDLRGCLTLPPCDVVLLALKPQSWLAVGQEEAQRLAAQLPGVPLVQFWGDVDRSATEGLGIRVLPARDPGKGRMGILLSDLGPEPAIRLQTGGLKVGEILSRARLADSGVEAVDAALSRAIASGYGMVVQRTLR